MTRGLEPRLDELRVGWRGSQRLRVVLVERRGSERHRGKRQQHNAPEGGAGVRASTKHDLVLSEYLAAANLESPHVRL